MKFEPELAQRLIEAKCFDRVAAPKGFALELATEKGVYMARINKNQIVDLYKRSKAGDVEAMYVVSTLYDLGIGVPENKQAASDWANFSILQGGSVTFELASRRLKSDIANSINVIKDGFVYPARYVRAMEKFKKFLSFGIFDDIAIPKNSGIRVAPFISGVQVAACYRKVKGENEWVLYDMWTLEEGRMLPAISHFGSRILPMKLSEWLNGDRVSHSSTVGIQGQYVFVYGTLAVRKDKMPALKKALPDMKSARNLLDAYLASPTSVNPFSDAEIKPLRDAAVRAKKRYTETGKGKKEYREAKRKYIEARDEFESASSLWESRQPQTYLDFVACDMVGYSKGSILHITDLSARNVKLQSTGFIPVTTRFIDTAGIPMINDSLTFKKHHTKVFERFKEIAPYRLIGLEVLQLDDSGMNADSRIVYRVKE